MSSSAAVLGQKFKEPVKQTIIPIMEWMNSSGEFKGFFPITETEFDGTERTYEVEEGNPVQIISVRQPQTEESHYGFGATEFMAAVYMYEDAKNQPWIGYQSWVDLASTQYSSTWIQSGDVTFLNRYNPGYLIGSLKQTMNTYNFDVPAASPTPPDGEDATLNWINSIAMNGTAAECAFFDFNWVALFQNTPQILQSNNTFAPTSIQVAQNPAGGEFKAVVVQSAPSITPGTTGYVFDTVRIIKLQNAAPGDYVFQFTISANVLLGDSTTVATQVTKNVILTLTVKDVGQ